jgi:hemolysin activation/secretion protein
MKSPHRTSAALLLSLGFALSSVGAQPVEQVAPEPKVPGATGIVTPDSVGPARVEDARGPAAAAPGAVTSADEARLNTVLLSSLKGLAFTTSAEGARAAGPVTGVSAPAELALLDGAEFRDTVAARHLGRPVTLASIQALNREVVEFFKANKRPVVDVIVPEQDITAGTLRLIVLEARLGQVSVRGNQHFSSELLKARISAAPGETINSEEILGDLNWLNQNPFRRVGLVYARGAEVGTTDLILEVEDRRPLRFFAGYEDSGTEATGDNRWLAGVNWGNAFGLDHQLNYQFTMADDTDDFYAHSGSYVVPLPWRHTLTFYAAYANSSAEVVAGLLGADGESYSTGFRYAVPLASTPSLAHELFFGYDYKYSENTLIFFPIALDTAKTEISQFNLGYAASLRDRLGGTTFTATVFHSPGKMTSYNRDEDFELTSARSSADYTYGRATLERLTRMPGDFSLVASVTGQVSDANLLVSEQLGAGGYATVRGYDERVANAEQGVMSRVELRTPAFSLRELFNVPMPADQLQFLGFWDYAALRRHDQVVGLPDSYSLSSIGVGLRYSIATNLSLRFDYGWQMINDSDVVGEGSSRGHVGVVLSY